MMYKGEIPGLQKGVGELIVGDHSDLSLGEARRGRDSRRKRNAGECPRKTPCKGSGAAWLPGGSESREGPGEPGVCNTEGAWAFGGRWGASAGIPQTACLGPCPLALPETPCSCPGLSPCPNPKPGAMGKGGETPAGRAHHRARPQPLPFLGPGKGGRFCSHPPGASGATGLGEESCGKEPSPPGP